MENNNRENNAAEGSNPIIDQITESGGSHHGTPESLAKARKAKKRVLIAICIIIAAFLILLVYRLATGPKEVIEEEKMPVNVKTATAEMGSILSTSPISGRIQPLDEVAIVPLVNGQVKTVYVKLGDKVSAGTVLFDIDNGPLSTSVAQSADALTTAKSNYERTSLLYNEGAVSLQQFEQAQSQVISAEASYNSLKENLSNYVVTSPISGYVTSLNVAKGGMASGSAGAAATIADTSELIIKTSISEYLIGKVKVGDAVEIYVKSLSENAQNGTIKEIAPAPAVGSLTYPIIISVNASDKGVKAGMFAEVKIVSDKRENVLCVPSDTVIIKQGISQIAVMENSLPAFKEVQTGLDNGETVEILSGISPGDTIIIEGQHFVTEGEPVQIVD